MKQMTTNREIKAFIVDERQQQQDSISSLNQSFHDFKEANDARLAALEHKGRGDNLIDEKVSRIARFIDQQEARLRASNGLITKQAHGHRALRAEQTPKAPQSKAFDYYLRRGDIMAPEGKGLSLADNNEGGVLVPPATAQEISRRMALLSPVRSLATVREVSVATFKKPHTINGPVTGWVGEQSSRPETDAPDIEALSFPTMELYAMPAATSSLLDDSAIDIDAWLTEEVEVAFAEQESEAFILGDGSDRPQGILSYPVAPNDQAIWGQLGTVATGADGGFNATNPGDALIELVYTLKAGYRQNAHFLMNRHTQAEIRKLKDSEGRYLWQPAQQPGEMSTLLGYPIAEADHMPSIASGTRSIAFGDFNRGYLVVDRQGLRVLRDPYSAKPYVLFYTTKRVGGGVQDFEAIKLLTFSA